MLTNTGQVSSSQVKMMREKIRTVGISTVLDLPNPPSASPAPAPSSSSGPPSALSKSSTEGDWAVDGALRQGQEEALERGSKRGATFNFDIGIQAIYAVGEVEEAETLFDEAAEGEKALGAAA